MDIILNQSPFQSEIEIIKRQLSAVQAAVGFCLTFKPCDPRSIDEQFVSYYSENELVTTSTANLQLLKDGFDRISTNNELNSPLLELSNRYQLPTDSFQDFVQGFAILPLSIKSRF